MENSEIQADIARRYNARKGPRVGDFLYMPDGRYVRFTYDWGDDIQTTCNSAPGSLPGGSFSTGYGYGGVSYSGGLDPALPKSRMTDTGVTRDGRFWHFDRNMPGAGRGVDYHMPCRVYRWEGTALVDVEIGQPVRVETGDRTGSTLGGVIETIGGPRGLHDVGHWVGVRFENGNHGWVSDRTRLAPWPHAPDDLVSALRGMAD